MSIQCDSAAVLVAAGERHEIEDLGEGGSGSDGAALAGLQTGDVAGELGVHHGHLAVLHDVNLATGQTRAKHRPLAGSDD